MFSYRRVPISIIAVTLFFSALFASDWKLNSGMFNPSGVPSLPFSQPRFADMDADGDLDMILGSTSDKPLYLTNTGTTTSPKFTYIEDLFSNVTGVDAEFGVAHDIDADGDLDLITGGHTGLQLYRNTGNAIAGVFEKADGFFSSMGLSAYPVADLGDVDGDGDLDMVVGFSEDGAVKIYLNTGSDTAAVFGSTPYATLGDLGLFAYPVFCDPDNDGDLDILCGQDGHYLTYFQNMGSSSSPSWQSNGGVFNGIGASTYFNSPVLADITGDGKEDLVFGSYEGPLNYYKNTGSTSSPAWTINTSLFGGVLDVGAASSPVFVDLDHDGDLDMITGTQMGDIKSYLNTGTVKAPLFAYNMTHSNLKHSLYSFVSIAEVNGDGSLDALVGDFNGTAYYHEGSGTGFLPASSALPLANVGAWAAPRFVDMDFDGDQDVVIGNEDGLLTYFENVGSASQPLWSEISNYFGGLDVGSDCVPAFADLDFDGDLDLLTSGGFHTLRFYENVDGAWVEDTTQVEGIEVKQNATPTFADLDGDGDQDLILGNYDGTFDYYENLREVVAVIPVIDLPEDYNLSSYPNPFNPQTAISFTLSEAAFVDLSVYDLTGKNVATVFQGFSNAGHYTLNFKATETMSTGLYFCRMSINGTVAKTMKLTYLK